MTHSTRRILNPDGTFNVRRNRPSGLRVFVSHDLYHHLLAQPWLAFWGVIFGSYFSLNLCFATLFFLLAPAGMEGLRSHEGWPLFLECFFFSVQTMATIGYGRINPVGILPNLLVTFEAFLGLMSVALGTGMLFARFSRPTSRVLFSQRALLTFHDGVKALQFRMANGRSNQIVEAKVTVTLVRNEVTEEGESYRTFTELKTEHGVSPLFVLSWLVVHPICEDSPLFGRDEKWLREVEAEILVTLVGTDETFSQQIYARYSYTPDEILSVGKFRDIISRDDYGKLSVDHNHLSTVDSHEGVA